MSQVWNSFSSDRQCPQLCDTLPRESVILVLQLVDKTDQGVLQVGHLTDECFQGQLQLLLLSLKKGKKDKGRGQGLTLSHGVVDPHTCIHSPISPTESLLYRGRKQRLWRLKSYGFTLTPSPWVGTLRQKTYA